MKIDDAARLIENAKLFGNQKQIWCDLGCGAGTFTLALAQLLPNKSVIYAVDRDANALRQIPARFENVEINKIRADFVNDKLNLPPADGILMANALHYVKEKKILLQKIMKITNRSIIIEYDSRKPSVWHPFPLDFQALQALLTDLNYLKISKLGRRKSIYEGEIYSALIEKI